jgi:uncharacterized membrane protein
MSEPVRRRGRVPWLFVALAVSLVANAFLVGAFATDMLRFTYGEKRPVSFEMRWLEERLAPDDFATVAAAVDASRPAAYAHFDRLRELRNELGVLAAAPEPDRAAIETKLGEIRDEQRAMVGRLQATIIESLLALPPAARTTLATPAPETGR